MEPVWLALTIRSASRPGTAKVIRPGIDRLGLPGGDVGRLDGGLSGLQRGRVSDGEDLDVLEDELRLLLAGGRALLVGGQHQVHVVTGDDEPGHSLHVADGQGDGLAVLPQPLGEGLLRHPGLDEAVLHDRHSGRQRAQCHLAPQGLGVGDPLGREELPGDRLLADVALVDRLLTRESLGDVLLHQEGLDELGVLEGPLVGRIGVVEREKGGQAGQRYGDDQDQHPSITHGGTSLRSVRVGEAGGAPECLSTVFGTPSPGPRRPPPQRPM